MFAAVVVETYPHLVIDLFGELDVATVGDLVGAVSALLDDGVPEIVLNVEPLSFIDSTGLGAIVGLHKQAQANGAAIVLRNPSSMAVKILGVSGLDNYLTIETTARRSAREVYALQTGEHKNAEIERRDRAVADGPMPVPFWPPSPTVTSLAERVERLERRVVELERRLGSSVQNRHEVRHRWT